VGGVRGVLALFLGGPGMGDRGCKIGQR